MYSFFSAAGNDSNTGMGPGESLEQLSPVAIVGVVLSIFVVLGGAVYCGWRQYRCWCAHEPAIMPSNLPPLAPRRVGVLDVMDREGNLQYTERTYPDGSILVIETSETSPPR